MWPNITLAAAGLAVLLAAAPAAANTCINVRNIKSSIPTEDGSAIVFTMNNGKVYRNDLRGKCTGLRFDGFAWVLRGSDLVCDNQQAIRIIHSGGVCLMGKFTDVTTAQK